VVPAGRLYFCQHLTRGQVRRDAWRSHANGTVGVARATIRSDTPTVLGDLLARMFGAEAIRTIQAGVRLVIGLAAFDIVTPDEVARRFGDAAPDPQGRRDDMVALTLRTRALAMAAKALRDGGIPFDETPERVLVSAAHTMGATLEFVT
jgi:hypothetical protein